MGETNYIPTEALRPYINSVMVMQSEDPMGTTNIPIFADGFPGIMFQQSSNGVYMMPRNKELSELFLYGQTLEPISLVIKGRFNFTLFQLYPFASKYLLDVDPSELNDECYDLFKLKQINIESYAQKLRSNSGVDEQVNIMTSLILELIEHHKVRQDDRIQRAITLIINNKGQTSIKAVRDQLFITERTFERQFLAQVGLSPKQFAKIIQFKSSLHKISRDDYGQLLEVGLDSGFADQSHFSRSFKKYTGKTPTEFIRQNSV